MADFNLSVEKREEYGKGAAKRTRRSGKLPGVLYGDGKSPVPLTVELTKVEEILDSPRGENLIFDLELTGTGQRRPVMIHEYQRHPLSQALVHVDFVRINMERKVQVRVPIRVEGIPVGVSSQGGILEFLQREVSLECLPADIPEQLKLDVGGLHVGQSLRVQDLEVHGAEIRMLDDAETVVVAVSLPAAEKEAAMTTAEGAPETEEPAEDKKEEVPGEGAEKEGT